MAHIRLIKYLMAFEVVIFGLIIWDLIDAQFERIQEYNIILFILIQALSILEGKIETRSKQ